MTERMVENVAIDKLVCRKQVRENFDEEELLGLAQSIREHGILHPLIVHRAGDTFVVADGERRLRAAKCAGLPSVPVLVEARELDPGEMLQVQLISNLQRQDLSAMEKARAFDRLMKETGWPASEVAVRLGLSPAGVSRSLALLTLPESVQRRVEAGELAASTAYQIACAGEAAGEQERLAAEAAAGKLTRDAIAGRRRARKEAPAKTRRAAPARVTAPLGEGRSVTVAGPDLASIETLIELLEELLAKARKARPRGIELATFIALLRDEAKSAGGK